MTKHKYFKNDSSIKMDEETIAVVNNFNINEEIEKYTDNRNTEKLSGLFKEQYY